MSSAASARRRAGRRQRHRRRQPDRQRPRRASTTRSSPAARRSARSALDLPGIDLPAVPVAAADFDAAGVIAPSRVPLDRGTAMALAAADAAARDAGLAAGTFDPERLGIFWGSGMAGAATFETTCRTVYADRRRMRPTSVVTTMPNAPVAELALRFGARGAALAYACACASSAVAIGEAMRAIRAGWIDVAIAGGSESLLTPGVLASWQAMRVLAPLARRRRARRERAASVPAVRGRPRRLRARRGRRRLRPRIDRPCARARRDAAASPRRLRDQLRRRPHHPTPMPPARRARWRPPSPTRAWRPSAIGYLNAHGTATTAGDAAEAESIARVFGANGVPVSSTKAIHGHLLGAGGAVELLAAARALAAGRLPPTATRRARGSRVRARPGHRRRAGERRPRHGDVELVRVRRNERGAGRDAPAAMNCAALRPGATARSGRRPAGTLKRNASASTGMLAAKPLKRSSDFWPKLSMISSAASSLPLKPTRTDWNAPSLALGFASAHSRPSFAGRLARSKSRSSEPPASSAAGVAPSAWPILR